MTGIHPTGGLLPGLRLLQITDSAFPAGGFAYSHGLEWLAAQRRLDERDLAELLSGYVEQVLGGQSLPAALAATRARSLAKLRRVDRTLDASIVAEGERAAGRAMGERLLEGLAAANCSEPRPAEGAGMSAKATARSASPRDAGPSGSPFGTEAAWANAGPSVRSSGAETELAEPPRSSLNWAAASLEEHPRPRPLPTGEGPDGPSSRAFLEAVRRGETPGQYAVAFAVAAKGAGIAAPQALAALGFATISAVVQAALRLNLLGQTAGLRLTADACVRLEAVIGRVTASPRPRRFGAFAPALDVAGLAHPSLPFRMFAT